MMRSPFYQTRRDFEHRGPIWLPPDFEELEGNKHCYITGTRGIGKTVLLKAMEWTERLGNPHFKKYMKNPFAKRYIGVYLKMGRNQAHNWEKWPPKPEGLDDPAWRELRGDYFSYYLEVSAIEGLCEAMQAMYNKAYLDFSFEQEEACVTAIVRRRADLARHFDSSGRPTLEKLQVAARTVAGSVYGCMKHGVSLDWHLDGNPGTFLREVGEPLLKLCGQVDPDRTAASEVAELTDDPAWRLKLCLDEAECLSHNQQITLNSLVWNLSHPFFLVVAYAATKQGINPPDFTHTFYGRQKLNKPDRDLKNLNDEMGREGGTKFGELICGVSALRLQEVAGNFSLKDIDIRRILGAYGINDLLRHRLRTSESKFVKQLLKDATEFAKDKYWCAPVTVGESAATEDDTEHLYATELPELQEFNEPEDAIEEDPLTPRIYEWYLRNRLHIQLDYANRRHQQSSVFRKRNVAALICICREAKMPTIPYAGYSVVRMLSQFSIRDFLDIMHEIYVQAGADPAAFITNGVDIAAQVKAIRRASYEKLHSIDAWVESRYPKVDALIRALGTVLAGVQGNYNRPDQAMGRAPEQGIISLEFTEAHPEIREVLQEASDGGLIQVLSDTPREVRFTLHCLFAPFFGFTYRKPYAVLNISSADIQAIFDAPGPRERKRLVRSWMKIRGGSGQRSFFDEDTGDSGRR